jgi:vacuolar-type H+-ATPase subunit F/Vma7
MADQNISIVVIAESAMQKVKDRKLRHAAEDNILPIVITVPDYREAVLKEDTLRILIKRAIGIDINAIHARNAAKEAKASEKR